MQLKITDLSHNGKGVGRSGGMVYFVEGALPGETVEMTVTKKKKRYGEGRATNILHPSPHRIPPPCPWFPRCGGCDLQHYEYKAGLLWKQKRVKTLIEKNGIEIEMPSIVGMENPWAYRNHMQLQVKNGRMGFYRRGSHQIVPVDHCMIQSETGNRVMAALREYSMPEKLRRIFVRTSGEQAMVGFEGALPKGDIAPLYAAGVVSVWQKEEDWTKIAGEETLPMPLNEITFELRPDTFFQVNTYMAGQLFRYAVELMEPEPDANYLDLFCGIGPIGMFTARHAGQVTGVEISPRSVHMAKKIADREKIETIRFRCAPSEQAAEQTLHTERPKGVLVDPPRAGLDPHLIDVLNRSRVEKLVYISCDPATLARDLALFRAGGWEVGSMRLFDMFPWTSHVETIALLCRGE